MWKYYEKLVERIKLEPIGNQNMRYTITYLLHWNLLLLDAGVLEKVMQHSTDSPAK
jgi:hypothetical protein